MSLAKKFAAAMVVTGLTGVGAGVVRSNLPAKTDYETCMEHMSRRAACPEDILKGMFLNAALCLGGLLVAGAGTRLYARVRRKEDEAAVARHNRIKVG